MKLWKPFTMTDRQFTALIFTMIMVVVTIILVDILGSIQAENITEIALAVIAISAVFVSVWQGIENRKHNRLSVKPYIEITHRTLPDKRAGIIIQNKGLGPAILKEMTLLVDEAEFDGCTDIGMRSCLDNANGNKKGFTKEELMVIRDPKNKKQMLVEYSSFDASTALSKDDELWILSCIRDEITNAALQKGQNHIIRRVSVKIKYESIYGDGAIANSRIEG